MKKIDVPIKYANRLINFGPVVLITSKAYGKDNIVTIAWNTTLSHNPMLVGIAVSRENYSNCMIKKGKEFVINIPGADLKDKVKYCGSVSGEEIDKFERAGLTKISASKVKPPLIQECLGHVECKLIKSIEFGDHTFFIGKVVAASAVPGFFKENYIPDISKIKSLSHLGGDSFGSLKEVD